MLRNNFVTLTKLIISCLVLFLFADAVSVFLSSLIIFFEKGFFSFSWRKVFTSFFRTGYVGGVILGVGIWIKIWLKERKNRMLPPK